MAQALALLTPSRWCSDERAAVGHRTEPQDPVRPFDLERARGGAAKPRLAVRVRVPARSWSTRWCDVVVNGGADRDLVTLDGAASCRCARHLRIRIPVIKVEEIAGSRPRQYIDHMGRAADKLPWMNGVVSLRSRARGDRPFGGEVQLRRAKPKYQVITKHKPLATEPAGCPPVRLVVPVIRASAADPRCRQGSVMQRRVTSVLVVHRELRRLSDFAPTPQRGAAES